MTGPAAQQDNSIEEILASIRQIISEDDPKEAAAPESADRPVPEPEPLPDPVVMAEAIPDLEPEDLDEIFDLTEKVDETPAEPEPIEVALADEDDGVDDIMAGFDNQPSQGDIMAVPSKSGGDDAAIFTDTAATATTAAFSKLSESILVERQRSLGGGVTLEEIVRELLHPLLREWINANVPRMVERLVQEELEKLARQAREG